MGGCVMADEVAIVVVSSVGEENDGISFDVVEEIALIPSANDTFVSVSVTC